MLENSKSSVGFGVVIVTCRDGWDLGVISK